MSTRSVLQQTTQLYLTVRSRLFVSGPCMSMTSGVTSYMMRMPDSSMIILCTASVLPFKMVLLPRRKPEWKMYSKLHLQKSAGPTKEMEWHFQLTNSSRSDKIFIITEIKENFSNNRWLISVYFHSGILGSCHCIGIYNKCVLKAVGDYRLPHQKMQNNWPARILITGLPLNYPKTC